MSITKETNESTARFLQRLGLLSGKSNQADSRYESLTWEGLKQNRNAKSPAYNPDYPITSFEDALGQEEPIYSYSGSDVGIYLLIDISDAQEKVRNFFPMREIQTLSISSARSVHPVRRLGESHVTQYTRGARTIAGTMVCVAGQLDPFARINVRSIREKGANTPFFTDELPSFSILIVASDEYGHVSHAALSDLTISNFGQTFSEADMYLENTYTYVARFYHPLLPDPDLLNTIHSKPDNTNKLSSKSTSNTPNISKARKLNEMYKYPIFSEEEIEEFIRGSGF